MKPTLSHRKCVYLQLCLLSVALSNTHKFYAHRGIASARTQASTAFSKSPCCQNSSAALASSEPLCNNCTRLPLPPDAQLITCQANVVDCTVQSNNFSQPTFILAQTATQPYYPWWYTEQKLLDSDCSCTCACIPTIGSNKRCTNCSERTWGYIGLDYRHTQTFHNNKLAECLFGNSALVFQGSKVVDNNPQALTADYFGLAPNFRGTLLLSPSIKSNAIDFAAFWNLGALHSCLDDWYIRGYTALVRSTWDLRGCATSLPETNASFSNFPECYMNTQAVPASYNLEQALTGEFLFGDMQTPWKAGRMVVDRPLSDTKLADITLDLGYTLFNKDNLSLSAFIRGVIPTGTRLDPFILFSPVIGNGHYGQFGGGIEGHYCFWRTQNECDNESLSLYYRAQATGFSTEKQRRLFNLKPSAFKRLIVPPAGSGYPANTTFNVAYTQSSGFSHALLLKEFSEDNHYVHRLYNASEFTTRWVNTTFDVAGEALVDLLYISNCWTGGIGYSFNGRSAEKIKLLKDCCTRDTRRFGIKGTTGVCARAYTLEGVPLNRVETLNATQSTARIFNNQAPVDNAVNLVDEQARIEFLAWDTGNPKVIAQDSRIGCDPAPVLLTDRDLLITGIPAYKIHQVFAHTTYQAPGTIYFCSPFIGIFGSVEWSQSGSCNSCVPSLWSVGIQTGLAF